MNYPCGKIYEDIEQGSPEWFDIKVGKISASKISDILAKCKNGAESASARNYRSQLVCERLTGKVEESYCNGAMQRGIELEPLARECYEFVKGVIVHQVAFVDHPSISMAGASPDGMVGDEGMVEIKCPNSATHIEYLLGQSPPTQYVPQMMWQMACTGRLWVDFVSYDDRMPEELQIFICRLHRNEEIVKAMEKDVIAFNSSVDNTIAGLKAIKPWI